MMVKSLTRQENRRKKVIMRFGLDS
uniref:Uncharacterized protein n=1 Tax=Rhizophora mucronata TaxID=61149 RepID=A0A2P2NSN3_RHIMU